jgi:D-methionine transport system ATP-binding protein
MTSFSVVLKDVVKKIPQTHTTILNAVSLTIPAGSISAFIGRSGAGKSTLLRCINGLESFDAGSICIDAYTMTPHMEMNRALRRHMGMIFQSYTLMSRRSMLDNVLLPCVLSGKVTDADRKRALMLLDEVGLSSKASAYPSQLSGGQKQRVAIARALMLEPGLLLCDELTSALDPQTTREILHVLKALNAHHGVTIIVVTHDMSVVQDVAEYVYVLDQGCLVEQGILTDVLLKPRHIITRSIVDATRSGHLPSFIANAITDTASGGADRVMRLTFTPHSSREPIIAMIATRFGLNFSIIAGSLDHVGTYTYGHLWVTCQADVVCDEAILFLHEHGVHTEKMGYLTWT